MESVFSRRIIWGLIIWIIFSLLITFVILDHYINTTKTVKPVSTQEKLSRQGGGQRTRRPISMERADAFWFLSLNNWDK